MLHFNGTLHKTICSSVCRHRPRKTHYSWRQREQEEGADDVLASYGFLCALAGSSKLIPSVSAMYTCSNNSMSSFPSKVKSAFFFHCKKKKRTETPLWVTNWSSHMQRARSGKETHVVGEQREKLWLSHSTDLTNLFPFHVAEDGSWFIHRFYCTRLHHCGTVAINPVWMTPDTSPSSTLQPRME